MLNYYHSHIVEEILGYKVEDKLKKNNYDFKQEKQNVINELKQKLKQKLYEKSKWSNRTTFMLLLLLVFIVGTCCGIIVHGFMNRSQEQNIVETIVITIFSWYLYSNGTNNDDFDEDY